MNYANYIWINLILIIFSYFIGSINISILISKIIYKKDIRNFGSKNAGATNIFREYGKNVALLVFIFDLLKSYLTIMLVYLIQKQLYLQPYVENIISISCGIGVILGHLFPIYFKFKGGKGVSCFLGLTLAVNFILFLVAISLFLLIIIATKYVSLASIIVPFIISLFSLIPWMSDGILGFTNTQNIFWLPAIILFISYFFVLISHRKNISRLLNKSENKILQK
ncbi:glycerol-3-phosphate 1-O-acyltransferase PlsY [Mycoplasma miroungirhinis]|uniref:Glycerol-3-phosphate acyltransferase n=1 Tax=Mycoplasma miroungirhinis TaxID=754516 RepID=A0A6M4JBQ5_9MOLU|nr:glycerol-3-phosphate 1-O-acyltransferase PlsY [Mycoplasma miroungirhinis]QJR44394.1 glycerol-3-phosphate 1-O-acyltransferase PlsY [Mycoplasma miroungirhinis]